MRKRVEKKRKKKEKFNETIPLPGSFVCPVLFFSPMGAEGLIPNTVLSYEFVTG